jgi:predicted XRE-type DNA-binding protein
MKEEWRDIKGYEGHYQVSNLGRVKSFRRKKVKLLSPKLTQKGYYEVGLRKDETRKFKLVHRLVAESLIPNPDNKPQVNHINGLKTDNRLNNLEWCTAKENHDHAVDTGLKNQVGENHPMSKLNRDGALVIIDLLRTTSKTHQEIAELCNTTQTTVSLIACGKSWKHLSGGKVKRPTDARTVMGEEKVKEIFKLLKETNLTEKEIATLTSITRNQVSKISNGYSWAHITGGKIKRPEKSGSKNKEIQSTNLNYNYGKV